MAVALDASTPAWSATVGGTCLGPKVTTGLQITQTSASFTPPANSLVAVLVMSTTNVVYATLGITVADSSANSYTLSAASQPSDIAGVIGSAAVFWRYYATSPGSITVTATLDASHSAASGTAVDMVPLVFTGAASNQSTAGHNTAAMSSSSTSQEVAVVTTVIGSRVVICGCNWSGGSGFAVADGQTTSFGSGTGDANGAGAAFGYGTSATGTPGSTTFGWTQTAPDKATLAALEILPAGSTSGPNYAGAAADLGGGSGSWANPTYAEGTDNATYATWAVP